LEDIRAAIKPDDAHFARSRLLALENTLGGKVLPMGYLQDATALAREHGLACHLDGARAFNAAVALNVPIATLAAPFDSISICLSKGLGAPVGSVLVASTPLIARARRIRKMVGGALRQVGVLAAAGLHALEHNIPGLAADHANAKTLAQGLSAFAQLQVPTPDTNIAFVDVAPQIAEDFARHLADHGVGIISMYGARKQRWVTHRDVSSEAIAATLGIVESFFRRRI
jgi:threonine aldolase